MGHPKGTAEDAPEFGADRERRNPDMSIRDVYAEDGEVRVQTGGMHEPYSVVVAERIRDRLDDAIEAATGRSRADRVAQSPSAASRQSRTSPASRTASV